MIPDALPTLDKGNHSATSGKACVMEYVSVLAGEAFSDQPHCTHPLIAAAARMANDTLADEDRHLLVPLIPRLLHANGYALSPLRLIGADYRDRALYNSLVQFDEEAAGVALLASMRRLSGPQMVEFVSRMLDEADRTLGHRDEPPVSEEQMAAAIATVEDQASFTRITFASLVGHR